MDRNSGWIVAGLVLAPAAIILVIALLRGYNIDIHFERDPRDRRWLRRKPKDDDEEQP
jgi:hypothetical protein